MELLILTGLDSGQTVSIYPADKALDDWATYKVNAPEGTGSDVGRYTASVDPSVSLTWVAFLGASQPTWADVIEGIYWDLSSNISANEVVKIQRSASEVAAGDPVTRNKVSATRTQLVERIT